MRFLALMLLSLLLIGCVTNLWTGASLIYDRHNVYKKLEDYQLAASIGRALHKNPLFKQKECIFDIAVFNEDVLLVGVVPTEEMREQARQQVNEIKGYRRFFNQLTVSKIPNKTGLQDSWITTKIRSRIFADSSINPHEFKVITFNRVVYLMGDVIPEQATSVIRIARQCAGVRRVVKLFKYYTLSDQTK